MKLLKNELWDDPINEAGLRVSNQVSMQVSEQVYRRVIEQVCQLVFWPVYWQILEMVEGEIL